MEEFWQSESKKRCCSVMLNAAEKAAFGSLLFIPGCLLFKGRGMRFASGGLGVGLGLGTAWTQVCGSQCPVHPLWYTLWHAHPSCKHQWQFQFPHVLCRSPIARHHTRSFHAAHKCSPPVCDQVGCGRIVLLLVSGCIRLFFPRADAVNITPDMHPTRCVCVV